jgi:hypothetical protein
VVCPQPDLELKAKNWEQNQTFEYRLGSKPIFIQVPDYFRNVNDEENRSVTIRINSPESAKINRFAIVTKDDND